jgi:hypothetical protein
MQNTPIMATFMALKGARTAQVVAHTGLDVRPPICLPFQSNRTLTAIIDPRPS